jgi:succinyl-diaminopimelate desuccinylase
MVDAAELADMVGMATDIPSPTGAERELAECLAQWMTGAGVDSRVQLIDERQANMVARLGDAAGGARLLLLAPLDTPFAPGPEDAAWLGETPRGDFDLPSFRAGDAVVGLGAENPTAYAVCALATALALRRAEVPIGGELLVGLVGGSMPLLGTPLRERRDVGIGVGTGYLLDRILPPDAAVVLKPGYRVVHEEAGFAWFRVTVTGALGYTGSRHKGEYRNPVVVAARVAAAFEDWFAEYTARGTAGQVAPQGAVTSIHGGDADRPAFNPPECSLTVDLRLSPGAGVADAAAQVEELLDRLRAEHPGFGIAARLLAWRPGTATPPDSWIVRRLVGAWEDVEGVPHADGPPGSGMSDGGLLRRHGVPTARIGLPPARRPGPYHGFSMGVADVGAMVRLTHVLIGAAVEVVTRTREELAEWERT